jgi:hypothetical protein
MRKTLIALGLMVAASGAMAAKPIKPEPAPDLTPQVEALEADVENLTTDVESLTARADFLELGQTDNTSRIGALESVSTGGMKGLVMVDANDQIVGQIITSDGAYTHSTQRLIIATKFSGNDRAYIIQMYGNLVGQNGYVEGSDDVMYLDSNCNSDPYMRVALSDPIGQKRNIIDSVGDGRYGNYIPDPNSELGEYQTNYSSKWIAANNRCERTSASTWLVPAMAVDMQYQYPLRAVFR